MPFCVISQNSGSWPAGVVENTSPTVRPSKSADGLVPVPGICGAASFSTFGMAFRKACETLRACDGSCSAECAGSEGSVLTSARTVFASGRAWLADSR